MMMETIQAVLIREEPRADVILEREPEQLPVPTQLDAVECHFQGLPFHVRRLGDLQHHRIGSRTNRDVAVVENPQRAGGSDGDVAVEVIKEGISNGVDT